MLDMGFDVNLFWLAWFSLAVIFFLIEMFTPTFITIFFSAGAILAGITALFELSLTFQMVTFFCSSIALLVLLRKKMPAWFGQDANDQVPFTDTAINAHATVVEAISHTSGGRIKYQGTFWNAEATEDIDSGAVVTILARKKSDQNTFIVKKD